MRHASFYATAALLVVIACAPHSAAPERAAATDQQHEHTMALPASSGPGFIVADVRFMQDMIGHHAQAVIMAALAPTHGATDIVLKLARKIDISQRDEINFMQDWLKDRNQSVPDPAHAHMMQMPGMLTPAQMAQLERARGSEFDRLFLTFMIQHHEGALTMAEALFANRDAAQNSDLFRFASDVVTDQGDEIYIMQQMLDVIRGSEIR